MIILSQRYLRINTCGILLCPSPYLAKAKYAFPFKVPVEKTDHFHGMWKYLYQNEIVHQLSLSQMFS